MKDNIIISIFGVYVIDEESGQNVGIIQKVKKDIMQGTLADKTVKYDTVIKYPDRMLDSGRNNTDVAHCQILFVIADGLFASSVIDIDQFKKGMIMHDCRTISVMPQSNERYPFVYIKIKVIFKPQRNCLWYLWNYIQDICYLSGPKQNPESVERLNGVMDAVKEHSLTFDEEKLQYGDFWIDSGNHYC